jgi:hypothetical protein
MKVNLLIIYIKVEEKLKLVIDNLKKVSFKKEIILKVLDFSKLIYFYSNRKYRAHLFYLHNLLNILSFNI